MKTLDKLHQVESLYLRGCQSEVVSRAVENITPLELARCLQERLTTKESRANFEQEYRMFSTDLYQRLPRCALGDVSDFLK